MWAVVLVTLLGLQQLMGAVGCGFPLRVDGQPVSVGQAPENGRYIVTAKSQEQLRQLEELIAAAALPPADAEVLDRMDLLPMLVANLSRQTLEWLCQDARASSCISYIESDDMVSVN